MSNRVIIKFKLFTILNNYFTYTEHPMFPQKTFNFIPFLRTLMLSTSLTETFPLFTKTRFPPHTPLKDALQKPYTKNIHIPLILLHNFYIYTTPHITKPHTHSRKQFFQKSIFTLNIGSKDKNKLKTPASFLYISYH